MLSKFSVKKPFTVVVAVIMVFILGAVSFMNMTTDLLPSIELPYVVVSTTYVGASPEKVESSVTKPMESALSTLSGVKSVSSISSENASIVMLEFEQGTNMDSASIDISNRLDQVKAKFDDGVGSPTMMRISPDMMPVMVASVDAGGKSVEEVTKLVNDTVLPALQRVDGVGSVTASGLVEQQLKITLDQGKIDELNDRVLQAVDAQLYDAKKELDDAQAKLDEGRQQLESGQEGAVSQLTAGSVQVDSAVAQLNALLAEDTILSSQKAGFETERAAYAGGLKQAQDGLAEAQAALTQLQQSYEAVNTGLQGLESFASTPTGAALFPNGLPASTVEELLALSPEEFEAFRTAVSSIPTLGEAFASLTQDGLRQR
ncbi:MAG: efflux RND transporter permease subunit [[Clostridium] leptum]